jgi:ribosomal protein S18 acetylase RimI-like enzyme
VPAEAPAHRPYHGEHYDLGPAPDGRRRTLEQLAPDEAEALGRAFAAMNPWAAYRSPPGQLAAFFAGPDESCARRAMRINGELAGIVALRSPWLAGPYLQFLGVLPPFQGLGLGSAVLAWIEAEAPPGTRNLWLCVSAINTRARALYERHGYQLAAELPQLSADHMDELLMRKRHSAAGG